MTSSPVHSHEQTQTLACQQYHLPWDSLSLLLCRPNRAEPGTYWANIQWSVHADVWTPSLWKILGCWRCVLQPDPLKASARFKLASPLIGSLIRQCVIPQIYPNAPSTPIPSNQNGSLKLWRKLSDFSTRTSYDGRIHAPIEIRCGLWMVFAMHAFLGKVCMTQSWWGSWQTG